MPTTTWMKVAAGCLVATSLALTGCGAGSRTAANTATEVACDFTNPPEPVTVNVLAYNSSAVDPFTNTMVASCSHDNVTLQHDPIDFAGQVQKTTATLAGETGTYDIIESYSFVIPQYGAEGKLEPLDDYIAEYSEEYGLDAINEEMLQSLSYEGKVYGLPMQAQMLVMAYRQDVFDELGLEPPTTFEEVREVSQAIQDAGEIEYPLALPWLSSADIGTAYKAAIGSQGIDYVDPDSKEPLFTSEESTRALEEMKSLTPYMDPQVTTFDQPKVQQQLFNGDAAMGIMFSGRMIDLTKDTNTEFAGDFAFAAPPAVVEGGKQYGALSVDGWSIPVNTKVDKKLLFELIATAVGEDASKASIPAAYPAREGLVTEENSPYATAANEAIQNVPAPAPFPWVAKMSSGTSEIVAQVVTGAIAVEEGQQQMQEIGEQVMSEQQG
ncbi:ABC transporter substrate-binding protein [Auraticoccus monumenti]|uniref:Carbohydrate ABC transporter substrate-binding protein, CUT1 family n=1 Tax=Auraticoccus monumenti TaxID=675864 RepID=A0A1G6S6W9_9ACTN|nr:extracellular solute-binding protein [Auraticoccus monumenti]SDD12431.1 carbohydrate ABC transporter substrate-binding protein, CUT1 family [Auraticoccus monumenti]